MSWANLHWIAQHSGGRLLRGDALTMATGVSTDSRSLPGGNVFFALRGENFDGHQFLTAAAERKASAVVIEEGREVPAEVTCAVIEVKNARQAMGELASAWRRQWTIPVVAVAGSNGKTTTKELLASVLSQKFQTHKNEASYNNDVGVPLTLLGIHGGHGAAVLEAGTNHPGELGPLIEMIRPTHGVLTGIGREHLEFFEDLEGVAREEGKIAETLDVDGVFFLNNDAPFADQIRSKATCRTVSVGSRGGEDWTAKTQEITPQGTRFQVSTSRADFSGNYELRLFGSHQVTNALLAAAVGAELGLTREEVGRGLKACGPAKMRMEWVERNGISFLNDAYNANADSMLAALRTIGSMKPAGRRVAVLGQMAELGEHGPGAQEQVGIAAAGAGLGMLVTVGPAAKLTSESARRAGLDAVVHLDSLSAASEFLNQELRAGDLVLLKASRVARLEKLLEMISAGKPAKLVEQNPS